MKIENLVFLILLFSVCALARVNASTTSLYFKSYDGNHVLNNNIIDGQDRSLLSENDDLVFAYKSPESLVFNGPVTLDLYLEFDVRDVNIEVSLYKIDHYGHEIQLEVCNPDIKIKRSDKINRVYFKTCPISEIFNKGETLLIKVRQANMGKIFNLTKLYHSPKYPSKIIINFDYSSEMAL